MFKSPRGTADILPEEQVYWRYVEARAAALAQSYGYARLDTPIFEEAALFVRSVGEGTDIVEKETYTFADRGGNQLTLRPEGTAPVCRAYLQHGLANRPQPVKLYYFCPVFRYERPQAGRYRQHHQFGVEALGEADPALDAEVIGLAWHLLAELGLHDLALYLNSIGDATCRPDYIAALRHYYQPHLRQVCPDCRVRFQKNPLRLLDCKEDSCQPIAQAAPRSADHLCPDCQAHFDRVRGYLASLGIPFAINHRLVRGLDYYTRTVFEIQPVLRQAQDGALRPALRRAQDGAQGSAQATIIGGGRYDGLIEELGGRPTPGVGFGAGMERMVLNLKNQGVAVPPLGGPRVFIAHLGEEAKGVAFRLAASLRQAGVATTLAFGERSLRAQLRQAERSVASFAAIIGEDEVRAGAVTLRDMATGEQRAVAMGEVAAVVGGAGR